MHKLKVKKGVKGRNQGDHWCLAVENQGGKNFSNRLALFLN